MTIYALDPGTTHTALCVWEDGKILEYWFSPNEEMLGVVKMAPMHATLAVEWIESYGMPVGKETFETVYWCGRFIEAWKGRVLRVPRGAVKLHLCHSTRAKDPNVRQALLDRVGPQGTKKAPGPTHGIKTHGWAALAVAVTAEAKLLGTRMESVRWNDEVTF